MRNYFFIVIICISFSAIAQVKVDTQTYTPQQLIENILIDSDCITNVIVTNVVGGNFNNTNQSYGYFEDTNNSFPFQKGLVLSTGKATNVEGPNTTLSDDDAVNWVGDTDLEAVLNQTNTTNATVIEFNFKAISSQISFNYIFASEEYQENNPNTCKYSDLFGFLIRPVNEVNYTNIALVPNTQTPVKVTTVHPTISGGCAAQNEAYFGSWNGPSAPINFNGQTAVLTATAAIIPNETYHVKLVIADEQNFRYDSAVFLEAGSFNLSTNLGEDRLLSTNNPLCFNETLVLNAFSPGNNSTYKWFKDNVQNLSEVTSTFTVTEPGVYKVEVSLGNNCISYGEIRVEYADEIDTNSNYLNLCDNDTDGLTFFDLHLADPYYKTDMTGLTVVSYFLKPEDAENNINPIENPTVFFNTEPNQKVYARIENEFGCFAVESLTLEGNYSSLNIKEFNACDDDLDGITTFNLAELRDLIASEVSAGANITFFNSYNDAVYHQNQLRYNYENTIPYSEEIWVRAELIFCELLTTIQLNVQTKPTLINNEEQVYCLNSYPELIKLEAGILNNPSNVIYNYEWYKNDENLGINAPFIEVNEIGNYKVIVSNFENCFSERTIVVTPSESAKIENILIDETGANYSLTVKTSGVGDYQFCLDNDFGEFQQSNVFLNVTSGFHTIYIQDINGCNTIEKDITIKGFPKFFTPNNDGINDFWKPIGEMNNAKIYIFDRFGKLLIQLDPYGKGWDGTLNGNSLPSSDYWYNVIYDDGKIENGHFTLKR